MPSAVQQLPGDRQLTALRNVLGCPAKTSVLREGPAAGDGPGAAWLAFLCPAHSEDLPKWPGTETHTDSGSFKCGTVLDFRPIEQLLQSHADLWLTPLTGVTQASYGGVWSDVLDQADRVLSERLEEDGESETLSSLSLMLEIACKNAAEGNLYQATVPLAYCEMAVSPPVDVVST